MRRCLLAFLLAAAALALLNAQSPERLVFTNAKLLDVVAGRTRPVAALVVEGAKIVAIHVTAPDQPLEGSSIRDLGGATLVPALADLAVQTQPGLDIDVDYFYAMSLAHGVMYVRAVDTHLPWAVAQRRASAAASFWPRGCGPVVRCWTCGRRSAPATRRCWAAGCRRS